MKKILLMFSLFVIVVVVNSFSNDNTKLHPYLIESTSYELGFEQLQSINNLLTIEGVALGKLLFYDTILSGNNKQSCGSCHQQQFGFTDGKSKSIGSTGIMVERNSMSLQNLAWHKRFFWDGRVSTLEELVLIPIQSKIEMNQDTDVLVNKLKQHQFYPLFFKKIFNDSIKLIYIQQSIAQFLKSIVSFNTKMEIFQYKNPIEYISEIDKTDNRYTKFILNHKEKKMATIVNICGNCHGEITYGSIKFASNGFIDTARDKGLYIATNNSKDIGLLKVPTLRNIIQTAPYMHDGSLKTLDEVLKHYQVHIRKIAPNNLSAEFKNEKGKLILPKLKNKDIQHLMQMFNYMTDSIYLNNKNYANPFVNNFSWQNYGKQNYLY